MASSEARVKTDVSLVMTTCELARQQLLQLGQGDAHVVGDLQRVGVGLLDDLQADRVRCR